MPIQSLAFQSDTLYYLKTLEEYSTPPKFNGSFNAIGGRGQSNFIFLDLPVINNLILSIPNNQKLWPPHSNWAVSVDNTHLYTGYDSTTGLVEWPVILLSSMTGIVDASSSEHFDNYQQIVRVLGKPRKDGGVTSGFSILIDSIPYQSSGDYSAFSSDKHPEFWLWSFTAYASLTYGPSDPANGIMFRMPLLNPTSGWKIPLTTQGIGGFYVDVNCIGNKV